MARAAQEWLQAALDDGWIECCYAYPHGGGCSISEVDSHEELMDRLLDYPMSPFVDYEVTPLVELDAAFDKLISFHRAGRRRSRRGRLDDLGKSRAVAEVTARVPRGRVG